MRLLHSVKVDWISRIAALIAIWVLVVPLESCHYGQPEPFRTTNEFVEALAEGDVKAARQLVKQDVWPNLDAWFEEHDGINCKRSHIRGVGDDPSVGTQEHHITYQCLDSGKPYCLSMRVFVREEKGRWSVIDWDDAREANDLVCP